MAGDGRRGVARGLSACLCDHIACALCPDDRDAIGTGVPRRRL